MTNANLMEIIERALEASHPGLILQGYSSEYVDVSTPDGARHYRITATERTPAWARTDQRVAAVSSRLAGMLLERNARKRQPIEIPSLGITLEARQVMTEGDEYGRTVEELGKMVARRGWVWCQQCDQYHLPERHIHLDDAQHVIIDGEPLLCYDPAHLDCHEPATVMLRFVPLGGDAIEYEAFCGKHWHERQMRPG